MLVTSCGGGSSYTGPPATSGPTAPAIQSLAAFTSTASVASVPAAAAVTLPTLNPPSGIAGGTSAILALPAQGSGGVVASASAVMSSTPPAGPPTLSSLLRAPDSRSAESELFPISGILFFGFSVSAPAPTTSLTFSAAPTFTITLPSSYFSLAGTSYYLALYDPTRAVLGWQSRTESCTATASALTLACAAPAPAQTVTLANNVTYYLALYAVSSSAAAPTPAPSVSPSAVSTMAPPSASSSVTLTTGATVTLPSLAGAGGSITLGTVSASTTVAVTTYLQLPPNLPNPGTTYAAPVYFVLTPASTVTVSGTSSGTFTPPTGYTGTSGNNTCPYIEMYDTSRTVGWYLKALGPGTCTGGSTTFTTTQSMTLTGGVSYSFAPYPSN